MTSSQSIKKGISKIFGHWERGDYDQALTDTEVLLKNSPASSQLHVIWASLAQLQESPGHDLQAIKSALEFAVDIDRDSPNPPIELGYFLDSVEDDPAAAAKAFSTAIARAERLLVDALMGKARALVQLEKEKEAARCMIKALQVSTFRASVDRRQSRRMSPVEAITSSRRPSRELPVRGELSQEIADLLENAIADSSP
jgi:tetratricopeptide (TPR) repeat protein